MVVCTLNELELTRPKCVDPPILDLQRQMSIGVVVLEWSFRKFNSLLRQKYIKTITQYKDKGKTIFPIKSMF